MNLIEQVIARQAAINQTTVDNPNQSAAVTHLLCTVEETGWYKVRMHASCKVPQANANTSVTLTWSYGSLNVSAAAIPTTGSASATSTDVYLEAGDILRYYTSVASFLPASFPYDYNILVTRLTVAS